jgi:hypothetical protein
MMQTVTRLVHPQTVLGDGDAVVRVGGRGAGFVPEMEIRRWDSQYVRLRLLHDEDGIVSVDQQAVVWTAPSLEARWYRLPDQKCEFATVFYGTVPHQVRFAYETSADITTTHQPMLVNRAADGSTWERTWWGSERRRPVDVGDSFALYVPWSGDYTRCGGWNYQSGKVAHLYRPWIVDAVGTYAWCVPVLERGVLTIQIPAAFRDTAIGPCLLDPTFGYAGTAASDDNTGSARLLFIATSTPASAGTLDAIVIKGRIRASSGGTPHHDPAIYSNSAGTPLNKLASAETGTNYAAGDAEVSTTLSYGSLGSGVQYWLGTKCTGGDAFKDGWIKYDASGGTANFWLRVYAGGDTTAWEATTSGYDPPLDNEKAYIYGSFTAAAAAASDGSLKSNRPSRPAPFKPMGDGFRTDKYRGWR